MHPVEKKRALQAWLIPFSKMTASSFGPAPTSSVTRDVMIGICRSANRFSNSALGAVSLAARDDIRRPVAQHKGQRRALVSDAVGNQWAGLRTLRRRNRHNGERNEP